MKKVLSLLLVGAMLVGVVGCGAAQGETFSSAAVREFSEEDADHVFLDDDAIALAQSIATSAGEGNASMRATAKAALDGCNAQRANAGLGKLT